jgi:hypothetical protein
MTYKNKLIEVASPLDAINKSSAREKSIRHGHPSKLHLRWARRPLASARAVIFAHRGLEARRVKLGRVMPGETPAVFGDAQRRLASAATDLYQDGPRYWYSAQPTATKLAGDRAEQRSPDPDNAVTDLERRIRTDLNDSARSSRRSRGGEVAAHDPAELGAGRTDVSWPGGPCSNVNDGPRGPSTHR